MSTMSVEYSQLHQPPQQSEVQCIAFSQYLKAESQLSAFNAPFCCFASQPLASFLDALDVFTRKIRCPWMP